MTTREERTFHIVGAFEVRAFAHFSTRGSGRSFEAFLRECPATSNGCKTGSTIIDGIKIGSHYDTTSGTLWKDGTYYPRGSRVLVVGMHLDQGFCVRFPTDADEPLETWEAWEEADFLAEEGSVANHDEIPDDALAEARAMLAEAEDGCHLHLQED